MSTNISKKKRDDLLDKIKQIRAFIAAAPQDEKRATCSPTCPNSKKM